MRQRLAPDTRPGPPPPLSPEASGWAICGLLTLALLATQLPRCASGSTLDPASVDRCRELAHEAEVAADLAGLPASTILALLYVETRCRPLEGRYAPVAGHAQIDWRVWGRLLSAEGYSEHELTSPWGVVAAGRVLGSIREWWPRAEPWRVLCLYSDGVRALRYESSCPYSEHVQRVERRWEK